MAFPRGNVPWNKGKKGVQIISVETKNKMRLSHLGVPFSEMHKQAIRKNHGRYWLGKSFSSEHKQKISNAEKGRMSKRKNKTYQQIYGIEKAEKIINKKIGVPSPIKGMTYAELYGVERASEMRKKISERMSGKNSPLYGTKNSKETIEKRIRSLDMKPNGYELYLDGILQNYFPDEWKFVGDGQKIINGLCPDFINVNGKKQIIELFGKHWHTGDNLKFHQTATGREKIFMENGYDLLIIWDYELKDEEKVIEKIRNYFL